MAVPPNSLHGRVLIGAVLMMSAAPLFAGTAALRDLTTDRPDTTESPYTIDAGHFQVETTLFGYARGRRDAGGARPEAFEFGTTNVRIGVGSALELDFGLQPYGIADAGAGTSRRDGIGAAAIRAKFNLWGNDGGASALAVLPYINIPLQPGRGIGPDDVEFGVLIPLAFDLSDTFGLGLNAGAVYRRGGLDNRYRTAAVATASLAVSWTNSIGSYFELTLEAGGGDPAASSFNSGVTLLANPNLQFDVGIGLGLSGAADRIAPFTGVALRF